MTTTIVVGSAKGGSGRTTLAINLAAQSAAAGLSVLLVDGTWNNPDFAERWMAVRDTVQPPAAPILGIGLEGSSFPAKLLQFSKDYDVVIVDTSRGESQVAQDALAIADAVVVPMQWHPLLIELHQQYGYYLCHARAMNPKLRIIMVDNQVPSSDTSCAYL
jgi:chromosome partitioning protein